MLVYGGIAAFVILLLVLGMRAMARSSSYKKSYTQTYNASRRIPRYSSAQEAAKELIAMIEAKDPNFYRRLTELTETGVFGTTISIMRVKAAEGDEARLVEVGIRLKRLAATR